MTLKASQRRGLETAPFFITVHAQTRFRERFCPGFTESHALREAKALAKQAAKTGYITPTGDEVWAAGEVRFVVRKEPRGRLVCITILPPEAKLEDEDKSA